VGVATLIVFLARELTFGPIAQAGSFDPSNHAKHHVALFLK